MSVSAPPGGPIREPYDPGSFRDRESRVVVRDDRVLRLLGPRALEDWHALAATRFFPRMVADGKIVATRPVEAPAGLDLGDDGRWAGALEHDRIPFVSYPYEWSFGMLRDAALLHLELLAAALEEGMILKDSSAFNVQWIGARPVFIDLASFQRLVPGEPWIGYRQFCQLFLYPLLLQAHRGVPFHPWLRGAIDGISPADCRRLMSFRDLFRPGVLPHVVLQAKLERRYQQKPGSVRRDLRAAGFRKEAIRANARGLEKVVRRLRWEPRRSVWSDYAGGKHYSDEERERKMEFVRQAVEERTPRLVWDLGCNTGLFSRIAAERAETVVAIDADALAIERLFRALREERSPRILPLVNDVANPSPGLGWKGRERKDLPARGRPDLVLCLALAHHLVIGANIPQGELIDWLADLGGAIVIEFVQRSDPMVGLLLRNKDDNYADYTLPGFERALSSRFEIRRREALASGTRTLYFADPRG